MPDAPEPATAPADRPPRGRELLRPAAWFYGVVVLFAVGLGLFGTGVHSMSPRSPTLPGVLGGAGIAIALVVLFRVLAGAWKPMARTVDAIVDWIGPIGWPAALWLALISGSAEEVLFRGALWPHLGLAGTTLLFGLVHVIPRRAFWTYPLFALLAGLLFGLLREGTGSVWPPALAHAVLNGVNLVWIGRRARRRTRAGAEA